MSLYSNFVMKCLGLIVAMVGVLNPCWAVSDPQAQSSARPFGFDIINPVTTYTDNPDAAALSVQNYFAPYFHDNNGNTGLFTQTQLDFTKLVNAGAMQLTSGIDPYTLKLNTASEVRVYFVSEHANYLNTLGFVDVTNPGSGNPLLNQSVGSKSIIFPNSSTNAGGTGVRSAATAPLMPMDYVKMGTFKAGSQIEFWLASNAGTGAWNNKPITAGSGEYFLKYNSNAIWFTNKAYDLLNPGGLGVGGIIENGRYHYKFYSLPNSSDILVAVEDLILRNGNAQDAKTFNDLYFLIESKSLPGTPEPTTYLLLGSMLTLGYVITRKKRGLQVHNVIHS